MKYIVKVTYTIHEFFEVNAKNEERAKALAEQKAFDYSRNDFIEDDCKLEIINEEQL